MTEKTKFRYTERATAVKQRYMYSRDGKVGNLWFDGKHWCFYVYW